MKALATPFCIFYESGKETHTEHEFYAIKLHEEGKKCTIELVRVFNFGLCSISEMETIVYYNCNLPRFRTTVNLTLVFSWNTEEKIKTLERVVVFSF